MKDERSATIVLLLRCYLGFALFVPLGVGKLLGLPGSADGIIASYSETILGAGLMLPLLYAFAYALPFVEVLGGLALLVGWQTRRMFLLLAWLVVLLSFGTTLGGKMPITSSNVAYLTACLAGYWFADRDRYGISAYLRSRRAADADAPALVPRQERMAR